MKERGGEGGGVERVLVCREAESVGCGDIRVGKPEAIVSIAMMELRGVRREISLGENDGLGR